MRNGIINAIPWLGTVLMCCLGIALPSLAAPPSGKTSLPARGMPATETLHIVYGTHASPLDLRPPAVSEFAKLVSSADAKRNFTTPHVEELAGEDESRSLAAIRSATVQARSVSRVQAFADRFHREGLPIARLWESHSALVSLGLNQKGKPGLWLVQKTH